MTMGDRLGVPPDCQMLRTRRDRTSCGGMTRKLLSLAILALAACAPAKPDIAVTDVWARAVAPGQTSGAVYMTIANSGDAADRLISARVSLSSSGGLHASRTANGVVSMAAVDSLAIPANGRVELAPGGTHLMIMDLRVPMTAGERFFVDLKFEKSGGKTVSGKIVAAGSR